LVNVDKIMELANEQGITNTFLIKQLGLKSRTYFNDIKKHNRDIPMDKLQIIADCLHTTVPYLMDLSDEKEKPLVNDEGLGDNQKKLKELLLSLPDDLAAEMIDYVEHRIKHLK